MIQFKEVSYWQTIIVLPSMQDCDFNALKKSFKYVCISALKTVKIFFQVGTYMRWKTSKYALNKTLHTVKNVLNKIQITYYN